jgi:hypothetical protein
MRRAADSAAAQRKKPWMLREGAHWPQPHPSRSSSNSPGWWIQCAYSPAMAAAEGDKEERASAAGAEEEILAPAWSCESKPPWLW